MHALIRSWWPTAGVALLAAAAIAPASALAAPGALDPTFNGGAPVLAGFDHQLDAAFKVAIAPDGHIVEAGCGCYDLIAPDALPVASQIIVSRYNADGTHDDGFGGPQGVIDSGITGLTAGPNPQALAVGGDRSVYVGTTTIAGEQMARSSRLGAGDGGWGTGNDAGRGDLTVIKYDEHGVRLGQARITLPFSIVGSQVAGLLPTADGGVLVVGTYTPALDIALAGGEAADASPAPHVVVAKLTAAGTLDPSFDTDGILLPDLLPSDDTEVAVGIGHQPGAAAGTFVIGGWAENGTNDPTPRTGWAARLTADGRLDASYGHDGVGTQSLSATDALGDIPNVNAVAGFSVGADDDAYLGEARTFTVRRFTPSGQADGRFGVGGAAQAAAPKPPSGGVVGIGVQPGGRVVAAGTIDSGPAGQAGVVRFRPDGTLDPSFGTGGIATFDFSQGGSTTLTDLVLQADGKPVLAGYVQSAPTQPTLRGAQSRLMAMSATRWLLTRLDSEPLPVTPPATAPPAMTPPAPAHPATVAAASVERTCVSRRSFRIRLHLQRGVHARSASVLVNGRRVKVVRGARLTAPVKLTGLPKGTFTVKIKVTLAGGHRLTGVRIYHTCVKHRTSTHRITL